MTVPISTVTGNTAGCTLQYTIEIYSSSLLTWTSISQANVGSTYTFIVSNANLDDTTTNTFSIQTTDFATWADKTQLMRLRVKDPNSVQAGGNQVDSFQVAITYVCHLDEISISTQLSDQTYVFSTSAATLPAPSFS